ncbi:ApeI family dehydratase [Vibrio aphrogenes]|uniref:ApeI family dehydratase n=1 Tax=Vibrio aphrogenes TaxID=1891186 RepID=UPI000B34DC49|nr:3-hydroxyacyl-ACP dehydratase [Vibrio aphrogenes]
MSITRKPQLIKHQHHHQEHAVTLWLQVDADIEDFKGHFAQFPLLPGVTQIDWAIFYAQQFLQAPAHFQGMEVIKFQEPILKNSLVTLNLTWHRDKQKLYFHYYSQPQDRSQQERSQHDHSQQQDETRTHSSGRILLGES